MRFKYRALRRNVAAIVRLRQHDIQLSPQEVDELLRVACRVGALKAVVHLVKEFGADVTSQDADLVTPLHIACEYNHIKVAKFLLDQGARVDDLTKMKTSAISIAFERNYFDLFKLLVQPQYRPKSGKPVQIIDGVNKDYDVRRKFMSLIPQPQAPKIVPISADSEMPLEKTYDTTILELPDEMLVTIFNFLDPQDIFNIMAVCKQFRNQVRESGYFKDDEERWTKKLQRAEFKSLSITRPYFNKQPYKLFLDLRKCLQTEILGHEQGVLFDLVFAEYPDENRIIAALIQSPTPSLKIIKQLRNKKMQKVLDYLYSRKGSALFIKHEAWEAIIYNQSQEIIDDILERVKRTGDQALINDILVIAAQNANANVITKLLKLCTNYDVKTLNLALQENTREAVDAILAAGVQPNEESLVNAALYGHEDLFYMWYEADKTLLKTPKTILLQAITFCLTDLVIYLLNIQEVVAACKLVDVFVKLFQYGTPRMLDALLANIQNDCSGFIHLAFNTNAIEEKIIAVLNKSNDVEVTNERQVTAAMIIAERGLVQAFKAIVAKGAKLDAVDANRNTVLHYACRKEDLAICREIVSKDPRLVLAKNIGGYTALDNLKNHKNPNPELVAFLESVQADLTAQCTQVRMMR